MSSTSHHGTEALHQPSKGMGRKQTVLFKPVHYSPTTGSITSNNIPVHGKPPPSSSADQIPGARDECSSRNRGRSTRNPPPEVQFILHKGSVNDNIFSPLTHNEQYLPTTSEKMSSTGPSAAPLLNFTRTIRNCEPQCASSSSQPVLTTPQRTSDRISNTDGAAIVTRNYRKRLQKIVRDLDDTNHSQCVEFSCGLCRIIVPDKDTMRKHSHSHMHLLGLLNCYMESVENTKEMKSNETTKIKEDSDVSDSSDDSECSDESPAKKPRVRWNLEMETRYLTYPWTAAAQEDFLWHLTAVSATHMVSSHVVTHLVLLPRQLGADLLPTSMSDASRLFLESFTPKYAGLCFGEDFNELLEVAVPRWRIIRERVDHFHKWDDSDFFARFRLPKEGMSFVLNAIESLLVFETERMTPPSSVILRV